MKRSDRNKGKTRVDIGIDLHCWRQLFKIKGMKFDAKVAAVLLDWYVKSC